jgi:hypothetical protein
MKPTLIEKFIAYLALLSGLSISAVAVYYSVVGLTAIFAAAVIPIIIMGTTLEISKLVATVWLKQNWKTAPLLIKTYLFIAIVILMIITSMGIFGFLSKAHSDQNLVSGDVLAKIAVYDEKIKTAKENIEVNRKQLKQMDESVDQVMGRSADEKGADKSVALRKSQSKDRARLLQDISTEQKIISSLNEERAPVAAEVRKVEAEVGPIKYIAAFFYGNTDPTILEKSVTWVIITIIIVFDPLAIILLLASQISFQEFRERNGKTGVVIDKDGTIVGLKIPKKDEPIVEGNSPIELASLIDTKIIPEEESVVEEYVKWPGGQSPLFCNKCAAELVDAPGIGLFCPNLECGIIPTYEPENGPLTDNQIEQIKESVYIQNEEQKESNLWSSNLITKEEYIKVSEEAIINNDDPYNDRPPPEVQKYIDLVKAKKIRLSELHPDMMMAVKKRI